MKDEEGGIEVDGHQVWYRRIGEGGVPLLLLHGGPGAGHDDLEPLAGLAENRAVIFYDQLGCGRSDQPHDPLLWRIERFVREVDRVRAALGLDRVHILGQSWGGPADTSAGIRADILSACSVLLVAPPRPMLCRWDDPKLGTRGDGR